MPSTKRTPKLWDELAVEVANGGSIPAWAKKNKLSERTVYSWTGKAEFRALVSAHRRRITDAVIGELIRNAKKSVATIAKLAESATTEPVKLQAARAILTELVALTNWSALEERVAELEKGRRHAESGK